MQTLTLTQLTILKAVGLGKSLTGRADLVAPPAGSDSPHAVIFPALLARAEVAQTHLDTTALVAAAARDAHRKKARAARKEEKAVDASCAALHTAMLAEVKAGADGAQEMIDFCFPNGLREATLPTGYPQAVLHMALANALASETVTSNPAYGLIAAKAAAFIPQAQAFFLSIQDRNRLDVAAKAALAARDKAHGAWLGTFQPLLDAAAQIHGAESDAYLGWLEPLVNMKTTQKAKATRRVKAQAGAAAEAPAAATETPAAEDPPVEVDG